MRTFIFLSIFFINLGQLTAQSKNAKKAESQSDSLKKTTLTKEDSPIRSLSMREYSAYQQGDEMGMAKPATLNNYPAPASVLTYEKELKLSVAQKTQLKAAVDAIDFKAREMGRFILQHEKMLNDLFANGKINEGSIIFYSNQIGLYQGELRNAHLQACLKARRILTPDQLKKYSRMNGDVKKS